MSQAPYDLENKSLSENITGSDLRKYLDMLIQWSWLILLATALAGLSALIYNRYFVVPVYQSTTTVLISEAATTKATDYNSILSSERLAKTYSEMLTQRPVLDETYKKLNLNLSLEQLKASITVQPLRDTQLISVSVENSNPYQAADIANTLVNTFIAQNQSLQASRFASSKESLANQLAIMDNQINNTNDSLSKLSYSSDASERDRLQTTLNQYRQTYANLLQSYEQVRITEAQSTSSIVQVEAAIPSNITVRPKTLQNTLLAALLGAMLSVGIIFLIESLDATIKTSNDLSGYGFSTIGFIDKFPENTTLVTIEQPRSPISESFRSLRTNLQYSSVDSPVKSLLVTSSIPEEGKTSISSNLAVVLAQSGHKVILIDADLHRPSVHRKFQFNNNYGLSTLFVQSDPDVASVLKQTTVNGLSVLTSGPLPPNPSELLGSEKMALILNRAKEIADFIIVDTPPATVVTDAAVLSTKLDGAIVVVSPGKTPQYALQKLIEDFARIGGKICGFVLNDLSAKGTRYGYQNGYYYYKNKYYYYGISSDGKKGITFPGKNHRSSETSRAVEAPDINNTGRSH
jgi:polysaccharide biosynthesis transport protein